MEAAKALDGALKTLGFPVSRLVRKSKTPASTYFTYQLIVDAPRAFADDDNTATESTWRVDLYTKASYTTLLPRVIAALKAAEFYAVSVEAELYETDTGYYHVPIEAKYFITEE